MTFSRVSVAAYTTEPDHFLCMLNITETWSCMFPPRFRNTETCDFVLWCFVPFPFPLMKSAIKKTFNRSACSQFIRLRRLIHANYSTITRSFFTFLKLLKIHAFDSVSPVLTPLNSQRLGSFSITCERSSHRRSAAVVLIDKSRFTYHGSATLQTARQKDKRGQINERL